MAEQMPSLKVTITGNDGTVDKGPPQVTVLQIPKQMSAKLARMYVVEAIGRALNGEALKKVLAEMGLK